MRGRAGEAVPRADPSEECPNVNLPSVQGKPPNLCAVESPMSRSGASGLAVVLPRRPGSTGCDRRGAGKRNACGGAKLMFGMSIRTLLMSLFALLVIVVLGLGAFALSKISAVNDNTVDIATNWMPSVSGVRKLAYQL